MNTLNKQPGHKIMFDTDEIEKNARRERVKATQELIQSFKSLFGSKANRHPFDPESTHSNMCDS